MSTDPASTYGEPALPGAPAVPQPDWSRFNRQAVIAAARSRHLSAPASRTTPGPRREAEHVAKQRFAMAYRAASSTGSASPWAGWHS